MESTVKSPMVLKELKTENISVHQIYAGQGSIEQLQSSEPLQISSGSFSIRDLNIVCYCIIYSGTKVRGLLDVRAKGGHLGQW